MDRITACKLFMTAMSATALLSNGAIRLDAPGKQLTLIRVHYPPGTASAPHRHPGFTVGYVLSGRIVSQVGDGPIQTYDTGELFVETPDERHKISRNASDSESASLLAVLVSDIGAKLVEPLGAQHA